MRKKLGEKEKILPGTSD